jgi:hypothetical protein
MTTARRRQAATTLDELLDGVTSRELMKTADSKSSSTFERVTIEGESYVVKHLTGDDWLARASSDDTARAVGLWEDGVYDAVAPIADSTVVGAARLGGDAPYPAALLMRDVAADLVPEDAVVEGGLHQSFVATMARLHAMFWRRPPDTTLMPAHLTYEFISPRQASREAAGADASDVLRVVPTGWQAVWSSYPDLEAVVVPLLDQPTRLIAAYGDTPVTLLHGDWKMGNLGRGVDGRVVLLDWDRVAAGPGLLDLGWYVAVNCDRLPESKEATCHRYRAELAAAGVDTAPWWDRALDLALLGAFLQLGWSKAGQPAELDWWVSRVRGTAAGF